MAIVRSQLAQLTGRVGVARAGCSRSGATAKSYELKSGSASGNIITHPTIITITGLVDDTIDVETSAGVVAAVVPSGDYTLSALAAEMEGSLQDAEPTRLWEVIYDLDNFYTFQATSFGVPDAIRFLFGTGANAANSIASRIGFTAADTPFAELIVGGDVVLVTPGETRSGEFIWDRDTNKDGDPDDTSVTYVTGRE